MAYQAYNLTEAQQLGFVLQLILVWLVLPCINIFLSEFAKVISKANKSPKMVIIIDGASWHNTRIDINTAYSKIFLPKR